MAKIKTVKIKGDRINDFGKIKAHFILEFPGVPVTDEFVEAMIIDYWINQNDRQRNKKTSSERSY